MTEATDEPGYPLRVTRHIAAPPERVWQVMTKDHKAPVTLSLKQDDWTNIFATGVFWTKIDKRWRILGS